MMDAPAKALLTLPNWVRDVLWTEPALVIDAQGCLVGASRTAEQLLEWELTPRLGSRNRYETVPISERQKVGQWLHYLLTGQAADLGLRAVAITHKLPSGELRPLIFEYRPVVEGEDVLAVHLIVYHEVSIVSDCPMGQYASIVEATLARLSSAEHGSGTDQKVGIEFARQLLTVREQAVFDHLIQGTPARDIASSLHVSLHTVKSHTRSILRKLEVHSRAELLARFIPDRGTRQLVRIRN